MDSRAQEIIEHIVTILREHLDPSRIILFGSRAKKTNQPHADFDFAVEGQRPEVSIERIIKEKMEKLTGLYKVDIIYLEEVEPNFQKIVLATGEVVYEKGT